MTIKQKYLRACQYCIYELMGKGSSSILMNISSGKPTLVQLEDVLNWIDTEYDEEDIKGDQK